MIKEKKTGLLVEMQTLQEQMAPMTGTRYYSKNGVRIDSEWWSRLHQDRTYRRVSSEIILGKLNNETQAFLVCVEWHGVDDRRVKRGPPYIFDIKIESPTMIWKWEAASLGVAQTVYSIVVAKLKKGYEPHTIDIGNPLN